MAGMTTDWRRASAAALGAVDWALDLDSVIGGVFLRGGGLHKRRLPSDIVLGNEGDGTTLGLTSGAASLMAPSGGLT